MAAAPAAAAAAAGSSLSTLLHGAFVLLGTSTFALPAWEGITRGSPFYTLLFLTLGCLSFVLHCEDTGICAPLKPAVQERLQDVSNACTVFVFGVMTSVVFEVRGETLARAVAGAWALVSWVQFPGAPPKALAISFALSVCVLLLDLYRFKHRFTSKYYMRMATIAAIAAGGALLFMGVSKLWLWDGLWHVYTAVATYLLLMAQRLKRQQAASSKARGSGSGGGGSGGAAATTRAVTPAKRRQGSNGAAAAMDGSSSSSGGSGADSASSNPV
jgi:hypothetical protein